MDENKELTAERSPLFEHYAIPQKPLYEIGRDDIIFCIAAVITGIFTVVFGLFGHFALGLTISLWLLIGVAAVYFAGGAKLKVFAASCAVLAAVNSVCFFITSNGSVKFFAFIEIFVLAAVFLSSLAGTAAREGDIGFFAGILHSVFASISNIGVSLKSIVATADTNKKSFSKAIAGIACAIPVLIIIVPLLISSDSAFEGFVSRILSNAFTTVLKIILGVVLSVFVIAYGFTLKKDRTDTLKRSEFKGVDNVYIIAFLSVISICYLLYMFSQLAYFFSALGGFLPEGYVFTVAQYARRGFFEMAAIAAINFVIIFISINLSKKQGDKLCVPIKILCTFIILFTMLIIATALSKMILYIDSFGMTVLRITTSSFMVFLGIVFVSLLLKVYIGRIKVLKTALITAGCVLAILGTVNINAFAAKYNYDRYLDKTLPDIDVEAMYEFGDEGVPYLVKLAKSDNTEIANDAKNCLYDCYYGDFFEAGYSFEGLTADELKEYQKYEGFGSYSLPRSRAYEALYGYWEEAEFKDLGPLYYNYDSEAQYY